MSKKLQEITNDKPFSEITVDSDKMIIRNVALVGQVSKNGRRYTMQCLQGGYGKYEGVKVYADHPSPDDEKRGWRRVRDLAGKVENVRFDGRKIRGDLNLLSTDGGKTAFEIATKMPEIAGMSHNAFGQYRKEGDEEVVESIDRVVSVDVVTEPATNNGMFESKIKDEHKGVKQMDYTQVTMVGLKEARKDLVDTLVSEGKASRDDEFQKVVDENTKLKEERDDLKKKVDEAEVKEKLAKKEAVIDKILKESKLPDEAKTDVFKETLRNITVKEGEKLEDKINEQIEDRLNAIQGKKGVKNNTERTSSTKENGEETPEDVAADLKGTSVSLEDL